MAQQTDEQSPNDSDKEKQTEEIHQKMLTPHDASTLKAKLFELCKQADIDNNKLITYSQFQSVIKQFLPNATEKRVHEMFNTFDKDNAGNVSYVEFLSDTNFDSFLQYCGYFTYHHQTNNPHDTIPDVTELQRQITREFSIRNTHDKQIVISQNEMIEELNAWIENEGKPAQYKAEELQIEIEGLQIKIQELSMYEMEIKTLKSELISIKSEKTTLKSEYEYSVNDQNILAEKLKRMKQELEKTEEALKEYGNKEQVWKKLETETTNLLSENESLKLENKKILDINIKLEKENNLLQNETNQRLQQISTLTQEEDAYDDILNDLRNELKNAKNMLSQKNEEINDLRDKLGLEDEQCLYAPVTAGMRRTVRIADIKSVSSELGSDGGNLMHDFGSNTQRTLGFHDVCSDNCGVEFEIENERLKIELGENTKKLDANQMKLANARDELNRIQKQFDKLDKLNEIEMNALNGRFELKELAMDALQNEMDDQQEMYKVEIREMQKKMEQQQMKYELEIKQLIKIQSIKQELIQNGYAKNELLNMTEDENAPFIAPGNSVGNNDEYEPKSCVCLGFHCW